MNSTLDGIWKSSYKHYDNSRKEYLWSDFYVRLHEKNSTLIAETLPAANINYLLMKLRLDGGLATGSWQFETVHNGEQGTLYTGALQLLLDPTHQSFEGRWVALDNRKSINDGPCKMTYIGSELPKDIKLELSGQTV